MLFEEIMSHRISPFQPFKERVFLLLAYLPGNFFKLIPSYLREQNRILMLASETGFKIIQNQNNYQLSKNTKSYQLRKGSTDFLVFEQVILNEEYKPLVDLIRQFNNTTQAILVDAGSNVGFASIYLNEFISIERTIAIEPSAENSNNLKSNFQLNSFNNIKIYETGLWEKKTRLKLDKNFRDGREWSFRLIETKANDPEGFDCISIQDIFNEENISFIDILKIDIEGGEKEVFKAFESHPDLLKKIQFIAIEIHDEVADRKKINQQLMDAGFEIKTVGETTIGYNINLVK